MRDSTSLEKIINSSQNQQAAEALLNWHFPLVFVFFPIIFEKKSRNFRLDIVHHTITPRL